MSQDKPEIVYPCEWAYRIIGLAEEPIKNVVASVVGERNYTLKSSNQSSSGKFVSMALEMIVDSEEERVSIYESIKASDDVKMVL